MSTVGPDRRLNYYRMAPDDVIAELGSHKMGLTNAEASRRYQQHGANELYHPRHESPAIAFMRQFKNLFVIILLISAAFSLYLHDAKTASILIFIALMNASVGFFQEHKAESLLDSLEQLLVPHAKVLRNSQLREVDSVTLVIGDIVHIEDGDSVPADLRLLDEEELSTNDFALTGESDPSRKFVHAISAPVPVASRHNLTFMGTTVATGSGHGIVVATGMHTELGRIASLSQVTRLDPSPLQQEMNNLAIRIAQGTLILAAILAIVALQAHLGIKAALLFAIGISAAMIPNGLIAEVNITLAQTANKMAKARALVRKLSAVETLGATGIILTDKTGTLTKNEMSIAHFVIGRSTYNVGGSGYEPAGQIFTARHKPLSTQSLKELGLFFIAGALASNAKVNPPDAQHLTWYVLGDPTEGAIVTLARKAGLHTENLGLAYEEIREFQFDSARKLRSSLRHYDNNKIVLFVMGAPEVVLGRSIKLWDHGHVRPLSDGDRKFFSHYYESQADNAMRNIALAYRLLPKGMALQQLTMEEAEQDLVSLGIVSMQDPLRENVPAAMVATRHAHVKVSVITGDSPATAQAIAFQAKLAAPDAPAKVVVGEEVGALSDAQIAQLIEDGATIFSRVTPEDKLRLVEIAKTTGKVVAVTGDGINDAPALKRADIGVAMGKSGSDLAKHTAEIVLLDDSFGTLVGAIEQGRLTFYNIKKAVRCVMTDNAGELFAILISLIAQAAFHIPLAITAIQILAIDVIAQLFPVAALGWDRAPRSLMHEPPRRIEDHIITFSAVREFILFGLLAAALAYLNFLFFFVRHGLAPAYIDTTSSFYAEATILTYLTLVLCQFVYLLLVRADEHEKFFTAYLVDNKKLLVAFGISLFCILNVIYNPLIQPYFGAGSLGVVDWVTALAASALYLCIGLLQRHTRKHTRSAVIKLHKEVRGSSSLLI